MSFWAGKSVLITGVSGSLGSALSAELLKPRYGLRRLRGIARKWQSLVELERRLSDPRFRVFMGDVRDLDRMRIALRGVDYVIHAAAIKDVVLSAYNPTEAVATNVIGTQNVLMAAMECGVERVVAVSSDKAASPANIYGATKALAEGLTIAFNAYAGNNGTRYAAARYGNVVGSSGSVIPLFAEQRKSGTLTITHAKMTRFWITMESAVGFVMQCMESMQGGEIFVPHLYSARVVDIASVMVPDATLEYTGVRPGEKLHEVMVSFEEGPRTRNLGWSYRIEPAFNSWSSEPYPGGSPVPADWVYSSASAPRLTLDQIKVILPE